MVACPLMWWYTTLASIKHKPLKHKIPIGEDGVSMHKMGSVVNIYLSSLAVNHLSEQN